MEFSMGFNVISSLKNVLAAVSPSGFYSTANISAKVTPTVEESHLTLERASIKDNRESLVKNSDQKNAPAIEWTHLPKLEEVDVSSRSTNYLSWEERQHAIKKSWLDWPSSPCDLFGPSLTCKYNTYYDLSLLKPIPEVMSTLIDKVYAVSSGISNGGKHILVDGPHGGGKTSLVNTLIWDLQNQSLFEKWKKPVYAIYPEYSDFASSYRGETAANIRNYFGTLKSVAEKDDCVVLMRFDGLDMFIGKFDEFPDKKYPQPIVRGAEKTEFAYFYENKEVSDTLLDELESLILHPNFVVVGIPSSYTKLDLFDPRLFKIFDVYQYSL
jgi:hypothetical protein